MTARFANNTSEATHRYPTSIHWGAGYFQDGYKYLVAENDEAALNFVRYRAPLLTIHNIQKKTDNVWSWTEN